MWSIFQPRKTRKYLAQEEEATLTFIAYLLLITIYAVPPISWSLGQRYFLYYFISITIPWGRHCFPHFIDEISETHQDVTCPTSFANKVNWNLGPVWYSHQYFSYSITSEMFLLSRGLPITGTNQAAIRDAVRGITVLKWVLNGWTLKSLSI